MSNVLAIAAVTRLLQDLLNDALLNGEAQQALGAEFTVTALPPDRVVADNPDEQAAHLNLFLHRITPNAALRNADLPTRSNDGQLLIRPRLAFNLHYILTAVAAEELHAEILLGYAMQLFHEMPMLSRETIRAALEAAVIDGILPTEGFDTLRASEIADQLELLKITPVTLSMDDMSKMWTALQASYRTTVAYDVSVVLIERALPVRPTLPVLTRGGLRDPVTGRDPGVMLAADLAPRVPTLARIAPEDRQPVMRLGGRVILTGAALDGGEAEVLFREPGGGAILSLAPEAPGRPDRLTVRLPPGTPLAPGDPAEGGSLDPASWRVGAYLVELRLTDAAGRVQVTNRLPLALAPAISAGAVSGAAGATVTVDTAPPVRPGQEVAVLAGTRMEVLESPGAPVSQFSADFDGISAGQEIVVRLRVDGIDSPAIDRTAVPPALATVTVT